MKLYEPFRHWKTFLIQDGVQDGGQKCYLHEMDPYNTRIISKLLFYGQVIVRINEMRHFVIGQVFRYNMASKMATKIVYLNESNTKYTPVVYELRLRSQKWEIKSCTALNIVLLHINLMYP